MTLRRFFRLRRRSRSVSDPIDEEPVPGSAPRVGVATIINRYVGARPVSAGGDPHEGVAAATAQAARLKMPPRAASPGDLPANDAPTASNVLLPLGRRRGLRGPALWMSDDPLADPRPIWRELATSFERGGLWPLMLQAINGQSSWADRLAPAPSPEAADAAHVADHLAAQLRGWEADADAELARKDPAYHAELLAMLATGAAAGRPIVASGRRRDALVHAGRLLEHSHLGLVGCVRPAEVPARITWPGLATITDKQLLGGVLASWEERYGALLIGLSRDTMTFAVTRPPVDMREAREAASEQLAVCPGLGASWNGLESRAQQLVEAPAWRLRWDTHEE